MPLSLFFFSPSLPRGLPSSSRPVPAPSTAPLSRRPRPRRPTPPGTPLRRPPPHLLPATRRARRRRCLATRRCRTPPERLLDSTAPRRRVRPASGLPCNAGEGPHRRSPSQSFRRSRRSRPPVAASGALLRARPGCARAGLRPAPAVLPWLRSPAQPSLRLAVAATAGARRRAAPRAPRESWLPLCHNLPALRLWPRPPTPGHAPAPSPVAPRRPIGLALVARTARRPAPVRPSGPLTLGTHAPVKKGKKRFNKINK